MILCGNRGLWWRLVIEGYGDPVCYSNIVQLMTFPLFKSHSFCFSNSSHYSRAQKLGCCFFPCNFSPRAVFFYTMVSVQFVYVMQYLVANLL